MNSHTYSAHVMEFRAAQDRQGLNAVLLGQKAGVLPYVVNFMRTGRIGSLETVNKLRRGVMLDPLTEAAFRAEHRPYPSKEKIARRTRVVVTPARIEPPAPAPAPPEPDILPGCDWAGIASAATELAEAAADFQFAVDLHRSAELRLRAAQRRALAAGIAVAPALIGPSTETPSHTSKRTTQFFKFLSIAGAIPS